MIEVLIKYIQDKGYIVDVGKNILIIRKYAQGELCSLSWMILKEDLRPEFEDILKIQADKKCAEIDKAIAEW